MDEYTTEYRVSWDHTDCTTRIYFTVYMKWLDDAITEYFRCKGFTFDAVGKLFLNGERVVNSFAIGEYTCRINRPSKFDDMIRVRVKVKEMREKVLVFEGIFEDLESDVALGHGETTFICVDDEGRSAKIPENVRARL